MRAPGEATEQIGMQSEVTIASDSSATRGICTRTDTLLNLADIGTKAHTSEEIDVTAEADATTLERAASKTGVGMPHQNV